jgi:hypothetical protein
MNNNTTTTEQAPVKSGDLVGRYIRFEFNHLFQVVKCNLRILSVKDGVVRAKIPARIMSLPFPPYGKTQNVARFELSKVMRCLVS